MKYESEVTDEKVPAPILVLTVETNVLSTILGYSAEELTREPNAAHTVPVRRYQNVAGKRG